MVGLKKEFASSNCESMKMQFKGYFLYLNTAILLINNVLK